MGLLPFTVKVFGRSELGLKGEELATAFLKRHGLRILARNYRFGRREIDIIAQEKQTVCFIEVKTRSTQTFGLPQEAVTRRKKHHLTTLALSFIKRHSLAGHSFRFDVVSLIWNADRHSYDIEHIKNAFSVENRWSL